MVNHWEEKVGTLLHGTKEIVEYSGVYKAPGGSGTKALFKWKCVKCEKIYGPSQWGDIKRLKGSQCCTQSKKYGEARWGFKSLKPAYMRSLHYSASKRKLAFEVTAKYLYELMESQSFQCAYTGTKISFEDGTASLDRIDSKMGYVVNNVQWVYLPVNHMKWDLPEYEFVKLCSLVSRRAERNSNNDQ